MAPVPEILFRSFSPFINSNLFRISNFSVLDICKHNPREGPKPAAPPARERFRSSLGEGGRAFLKLECDYSAKESIESHGTAKNPARRLRVEFRGMARKLLSGGLAAKPLVGILFALFSGG